jgi:hypothetical protein
MAKFLKTLFLFDRRGLAGTRSRPSSSSCERSPINNDYAVVSLWLNVIPITFPSPICLMPLFGADAEEGAEGGFRRLAPVKAEDELVEVGLEMLTAQATFGLTREATISNCKMTHLFV